MAKTDLVEYRLTIKNMLPSERPRERLQALGASTLSNADLLAILLRTGTAQETAIDLAQRLLVTFGGLVGLVRANFAELCDQHGLGLAKAATVKAALELGRRLALAQPDERPLVHSPADVAGLLMSEMGLLDQEQLRVVLLNNRNAVLASPIVYQGNVNTSVIRLAELFREAVRHNAVAIIVAHNHPSGDPTPSPEDVRVTEQLVAAGKTLDIEVLDHLVIGQQRYVSLKEQRLGFK
ncbi:MAG: JAB domain-containing protein [Chloroflexi bacterium]|nr:JAB domain-containing protein [Chloroflexota bacterium]